MHALLVATGALAGAAAGALLDPLGQRLADVSRATEDRRRAERAERRAAAADVPDAADAEDGAPGGTGPRQVPELDPTTGPGDAPGGDEGTAPPPVRHLLPEGRSVPRTVGAAVATALLFALAAARLDVHGHPVSLLVVLPFWVFLAMAVTVSVTDLTHRLVPRQVLYGALVLIVPLLVLVSLHLHAWRPLLDAAVAGAVAFGVFFVIWFFVPRGLGFGDVRLAGVIGVTVGYLGLLETYVAFLVGFVLGLLFGVVLMVGSGAGRKTRIPFAPALCIGAAVAIIWGPTLTHHLFHAST